MNECACGINPYSLKNVLKTLLKTLLKVSGIKFTQTFISNILYLKI